MNRKRGPTPFLPFLLLTLCLLALSGCGKKTDPLPPEKVRPAAIEDLAYRLSDEGAELSWSVPTRSEDGSRLNYRIGEFALYRAELDPGGYRAGVPVRFGSPRLVANQPRERGRMVYPETQLSPGRVYVYQVKSRAGWLMSSQASNRIAIIWQTPPAPPRELTAEVGDRLVELRWQAPAGPADGLRWQVYRSGDGKSFAPVGSPQGDTVFMDREVTTGRRYFYQVRTVQMAEESRSASLPGDTVSVVVLDPAPPAAPLLVTLVPGAEGVRLLWEAPAAQELAEFLVLRRLEGEAEPSRIGRVIAPAFSFVDPAPPLAAAVWYYSLVAVDRGGRHSEASNELAFSRQR